MTATNEERRKTSEAEAAWARKNVWGQDPPAESEDEMGDTTTILGDVTINPPHHQPQQSYTPPPQPMPQPVPPPQPMPQPVPTPQPTSKLPGWLAPVLLGAAVPTAAGGAALATYMATRPDPAEYVDQSTSFGVGKIEDYLKE